MQHTYSFPDVTLLVTHYNRSHSLENLLARFQALGCQFGAIVVSDDGSNAEHQAYLAGLQIRFPFRLVTTPVNKGLGNNINKGQDAVQTPYTLYVQEDFEPLAPFPDRLVESLAMLKSQPEFDIIRYYSYLRYPYLKPFTDHFSEMVIPRWATNYIKIYAYSDHPHLRHSSFLQRFGRYAEGLRPDKTEYWMCVSFIRKKGKGLFYLDYKSLFVQKNSQDEPSTYRLKQWTVSNNALVAVARYLYRQVKYNYDLYIR